MSEIIVPGSPEHQETLVVANEVRNALRVYRNRPEALEAEIIKIATRRATEGLIPGLPVNTPTVIVAQDKDGQVLYKPLNVPHSLALRYLLTTALMQTTLNELGELGAALQASMQEQGEESANPPDESAG